MDILIFIVALSVLVLVHEFGHYFAAKFTGVRVEEFGLGLPPMIWGKKIGKTIWSLNWLPIGGFCKLEGESPEEDKKSSTSFMYKNPWQKGLIVLGGVIMNLVLAVVIFSTVYTILGIPETTNKVKVISVVKDSPAEKSGLKENDWVLSVNGTYVSKPEELTKEVAKDKGEETNLLVNRDGQLIPVSVLVRENPPSGQGAMGVAISNTEMKKIAWYQFYKGIVAGFKEAYYWGKIIFGGITKMVGGLLVGKVPSDVAGPIGMYEATTSIKKSQGILAVVHFFGVVSVNLAVVNVLPFPALDGGRIIFVIYEMITRKRANQKFEGVVNNIGMIILLSMILLITAGDIWRIVTR